MDEAGELIAYKQPGACRDMSKYGTRVVKMTSNGDNDMCAKRGGGGESLSLSAGLSGLFESRY